MGSIILLVIGGIATGFVCYDSFFRKEKIEVEFYALRFKNLNNWLK